MTDAELDVLIHYAMYRRLIPRLKVQLYGVCDHVLALSGENEPFDPDQRVALMALLIHDLAHFLTGEPPSETIGAAEIEDDSYLKDWFSIDDPHWSFKR